MSSYAAELEFALHLADIADQLTMSRYRADDLVVDAKPDLTPVTEADRNVELELRKLLAQQFPTDAIIGEEFAPTEETSNRKWIIDPIDGTKNYVRGVPVWATLIALVIDEAPVVGAVSAPAMARRWWASTGDGAFTREVNGEVRRLSVSRVAQITDASFSFSDHIGWAQHGRGNGLSNLLNSVWRARAYGDFWSHLLVAEGAVDLAGEPELNAWDMAAFIPIVVEAGGRVSGYQGGDAFVEGNALSTNSLLHEQALDLIAN